MVKNCIVSEIPTSTEVGGANPADATQTTGEIFQINSIKLNVPVVVLSINDNIKARIQKNKFLEQT